MSSQSAVRVDRYSPYVDFGDGVRVWVVCKRGGDVEATRGNVEDVGFAFGYASCTREICDEVWDVVDQCRRQYALRIDLVDAGVGFGGRG